MRKDAIKRVAENKIPLFLRSHKMKTCRDGNVVNAGQVKCPAAFCHSGRTASSLMQHVARHTQQRHMEAAYWAPEMDEKVFLAGITVAKTQSESLSPRHGGTTSNRDASEPQKDRWMDDERRRRERRVALCGLLCLCCFGLQARPNRTELVLVIAAAVVSHVKWLFVPHSVNALVSGV